MVEKRFTSVEGWTNEIIIYKALGTHSRLPRIHNVEEKSIMMEWMKNGDLARYLEHHADIPQYQKNRWLLQIAECFRLLLKHEISHCDSKLENFLLDNNLDIKIADSASSHNYKALSNDLAIQLVRYRRPISDFDENNFNPKDDVFCYGSICYEIVTGKPLFVGATDEEVTFRLSQENFPCIVGLPFENVIKYCWQGSFESFEVICNFTEAIINISPPT
jgi:serine/threonine protein kinase